MKMVILIEFAKLYIIVIKRMNTAAVNSCGGRQAPNYLNRNVLLRLAISLHL
jgi:hypothetical protein